MTRTPSIRSTSWSTSLETWARGRHGDRVLTAPSTLDFAPTGTLRPQTFYGLPVVLVVLTRRSAPLHAALTDAAEIIREATYAFRAVAVTDTPAAEVIQAVDWTVEHLLGEVEWAALQETDWLPGAVDHLEWARRTYGASLVLAPETPEQLLEEISRLGAFAEAPEKVLDTAIERAQERLGRSEEQESEGGASGARRERGLRGWWARALEDGAARRVLLEGAPAAGALEVTVRRGDGAGVLIGLDPAADPSPAPVLETALRTAPARGWSTVSIARAASTGATAENAAAIVGEDAAGGAAEVAARLVRAGVRAAAEAVDPSGPALLLLGEDVAGELDLAEVPEGLDGVVILRPGTVEVAMGYAASTECTPGQLPAVLERVRRIHLVTAL